MTRVPECARIPALALAAGVVALSGCSRSVPETPLDPLPALYSGTLPCTGCDGLRYEVDLRPDKHFVLKRTELGKTGAATDQGTWLLSSDGKIVALRGNEPTAEMFAIEAEDQLRKLDAGGHTIVSELNYRLRRELPYRALE